MKIENRIGEEDEHSQPNLKYLTRTQIPHCLDQILGLISCLAFHIHHQWKNKKN